MTTPDPARAALLRRLRRDGFVPPDDAAPWSRAARAATFAAEVEAFAASFWGLAPDTRRARYNALRETRYGPAAARLAELEWGLTATPETDAGAKPRTAASLVREIYGLRLRAWAAELAEWRIGTARVNQSAPGVDFQVVGWSDDVAPVPPCDPPPEWVPHPDPDAVPRGVEGFHAALADHAVAEGRERRIGQRSWGIAVGILLLLVVAVVLKEGCHPRDRRGVVPRNPSLIDSDFRVKAPPEEHWPWGPGARPTSRVWWDR